MIAHASTFVYVSNADDGEIATFAMQQDGELLPRARTKVGGMVMPMAVSPDQRFLYAAVRTKPFSVHVHSIDRDSGALRPQSVSLLRENFPYISLDRNGRFLFGASYIAGLISVNAVGVDGRVAAEPLQVIPVGRHAHSIQVDARNKFVFVPCLGSDQIFQFTFDANTGRLSANTPASVSVNPMTGPRHFVFSSDNKFLYMLNEMLATVTTFALDPNSGLLRELWSVSGLPPDSTLQPGAPRAPVGGPGTPPTRNIDNDIWAADIHMTPNGRFLYISERGSNTLGGFSADAASGKLNYFGSAPTEMQPRGFAIDPRGQFLVATGEKSNTISVYAIDQSHGALKLLQKYPGARGANWVEFVSFD